MELEATIVFDPERGAYVVDAASAAQIKGIAGPTRIAVINAIYRALPLERPHGAITIRVSVADRQTPANDRIRDAANG